MSKADKPLILPEPKNKPAAAQVNNVDPVNSEIRDPSALSFKERMAVFGGRALNYQKPSVAQRS